MAQLLSSILHWFYCLDLPQAAALLLLASLLFCVMEAFLRRRPWWRWVAGTGFVFWTILVIDITLIRREASAALMHNFIPFHSYREVLAGGSIELLRSNFMNAALFLPAGLLLPSLLPGNWPRWRKILLTVTFATLFSCGIECLQYACHLGRAEMDDLLHNSLGALLGGGIYDLMQKGICRLLKDSR